MARNPHIITNETPRISANELAKYMLASETGKLGIIRNSIRSTTAARVRYKHAKTCIKDFLSSGNRDMAPVHAKIADLQMIADDDRATPFAREDSRYSIDALNSFMGLQNQIPSYEYVQVPARGQPHLSIHGVDVSVNLDLLAYRTYRGREQVGGVICRFTKSDSDTTAAISKREDMGRYVAALAHIRASQSAGNRDPYRGLSMSVDVQFGQAIQCPASYTQRVQNIENACRFIFAMWNPLKTEIENG
jgi:hypothetical protein